MARRNRPTRPGENPYAPPPSGGGGGGGDNRNNRPNRPNNRNRGGGGGGGGGTIAPDPTTPIDPTSGTSAFAATDPKAYFMGMMQNAGFMPTDPTGLGTFLQQQAQNFSDQWNTYQTMPGNANADFYQFANQSGWGLPNPNSINNPPDNTVGHYDLPPPDFNAFKQQLLAKINQFGPQQTGQFDSGKRPSSTRYNLFG